MIPQPTLDEQNLLIRSLAPVRLRRFRAAVGGADRAAVALYLLDAQIASHLHATVRTVEVALREHLHRALSATFGERWFESQRELFDVDTRERLDEALEKIGTKAPAGKVVAQLMLGSWVNFLGRGDHLPDGPRARYHEVLWEPALAAAFDGVERKDLHRLAMRMNWARNRINHCEPVVFGFPQPGLGGPGEQIRRSPQLMLSDARELAGHLDVGLARWLRRWSDIDELFASDLIDKALDHVATDPTVSLER